MKVALILCLVLGLACAAPKSRAKRSSEEDENLDFLEEIENIRNVPGYADNLDNAKKAYLYLKVMMQMEKTIQDIDGALKEDLFKMDGDDVEQTEHGKNVEEGMEAFHENVIKAVDIPMRELKDDDFLMKCEKKLRDEDVDKKENDAQFANFLAESVLECGKTGLEDIMDRASSRLKNDDFSNLVQDIKGLEHYIFQLDLLFQWTGHAMETLEENGFKNTYKETVEDLLQWEPGKENSESEQIEEKRLYAAFKRWLKNKAK